MLKRKLLLFFAVAMIGIYAGGSCYLPSVQASASGTLDPGDTDTAPEDPGGDTGEEPSEDPGGDSGAQTDPPSTGDDDTQEPPDSGSDSGNTGGNTGGSTGDGSSENTGAANRQSLAEEVHQNPEAAAAAIPEGAHLPAAAAAVIPEAVQEVPDTAEAPEFPAAVPLQLQAEAARQAAVPDL